MKTILFALPGNEQLAAALAEKLQCESGKVTVRHVFSCVNPMGCNVKSFKAPAEEELKHDFMWHIYPHLPAKGMIQIFNRSHYEDILMPAVHGTLNEETINNRFDFINSFEKQLQDS
jgi:polyphosphate kinase 2 (PPK2 family)